MKFSKKLGISSKQLIYLFLLLLPYFSTAQNQRFQSGLIVGINFSELEGESITDYFGWNTGIMGIAKLSNRTQLGVEILFSQNGEYILPTYYPTIQYGKIRLNHLEIPIHFDRLVKSDPSKDWYNGRVGFGLAYTRLLGYYGEDTEGRSITDEIVYDKKDAWNIQAGATYYFTKKTGINLRASLPLHSFFLDWTISARFVYLFKAGNNQ